MKKSLALFGFLLAPLATFADECPSVESILYTQESGETVVILPDGYTLKWTLLFPAQPGEIKSVKLGLVLFTPEITQESELKNRFTNVKTSSEITCSYDVQKKDMLGTLSFEVARDGSENALYDLGKDWRFHRRGLENSEYYCIPSSPISNPNKDCRFSASLEKK